MKVLRQKKLLLRLVNLLNFQAHKTVIAVKDKIMSFFTTNTTKKHYKPTLANDVYEGRKKLRKPKIENNQKTK